MDVLANLSLQIGLLCLLVLTVIGILRIRSPLIRHRLWLLVVLSPLSFLLLDHLIPNVNIPLSHQSNPLPSITKVDKPKPESKSIHLSLSLSSPSSGESKSYDEDTEGIKPEQVNPSVSPSTVPQGRAREVPYRTILLSVWTAGCFLMFVRLTRRIITVHRLSGRLNRVMDEKSLVRLKGLGKIMSIRRRVELLSAECVPSPFSYGVFRPRIVLPSRYLDKPYKMIEMVLIHELGHIRRYDYLLNLICGILSCIFFFHPLYLYALRRMTEACEQLSDEWVVRLTGRRGDYARCLVRAVEGRSGPQIAFPFSASGGVKRLKRRVEMIMDVRRRIRLSLSWSLRMALVSFIILSLTGISTFRLTGASEPEEELIHRWDGPEAAFEKTFGGKEEDGGSSIVRTSDGGFAIVGSTHPEIVKPGMKIILRQNAWLIKVNDKGEVIWQRTFGGDINSSDVTWGNSVQQTSDGGFIIAGGRNIAGSHRRSLYLVKTDSEGKLEWEKTFKSRSVGTSVQQTSDGGYVITGLLESGSDIQVYLVKTDDKGNKLWWRAFGGDDLDWGTSVQQTSDGGFIIVGVTRSFSKFLSFGKEDVYLIKTDGEGNLVWQKSFGGRRDDGGNSVLQTPDGGYIIAGYTRSLGAGETDIYLIKTDGEGNLVWQRTFGGKGKDYGKSVCRTSDGGYVIVGETESFGSGKADVYLIKTDGEGNLEWQKTFGGEGEDYGGSVQQLPDGGFIVVGTTNSLGAGGYDVYLIRTQPPSKPFRSSGGIRSAPFKNRKALAQSRKPDRECRPIHMPPDLSTAAGVIEAGISPDGRQIVYLAQDRLGRHQIRLFPVRPKSKKGPFPSTLLLKEPGLSVKYCSLTWSPDGKWIAFYRNRDRGSDMALCVIPSEGGRFRKIAEVNLKRQGGFLHSPGLSWSPDSKRIAFVSTIDGKAGLYIVSLDSGEVRQLVADEGDNINPAWSPDGRKIAFLSIRQEGRKSRSEIRVKSLSDEKTVTLEGAKGRPFWSSDGRFIICQGQIGTKRGLVKVPISEERGMSGKPILLYEVPNEATIHLLSAGGDRLLFGEISREEVFEVYQRGKGRIARFTQNPPDFVIWNASWTPDGRRLFLPYGGPSYTPCFISVPDGVLEEIMSPKDIGEAVLSPDGRQIAFKSHKKLYILSLADGAVREIIILKELIASSMLWSPDERFISFIGVNSWEKSRFGGAIHLVDLKAGSERIIEDKVLEHVWSPDGTQIAFTKSSNDGMDICLFSLKDGRITRLASVRYANNLEWSPDGKLLSYETPGAIWVISVADGKRRSLCSISGWQGFGGVQSSAHRRWMPDGGGLVTISRKRIGIISLDGREEIFSPISSEALEGQIRRIVLSPDGQRLFLAFSRSYRRCFVISTEGTVHGETEMLNVQSSISEEEMKGEDSLNRIIEEKSIRW